MTFSPEQRRCDLIHLLPDNTNAHGEDMVSVLAGLRRRLQGPMLIRWDRSNIHQRRGLAKKDLAKYPKVATEEFPGHTPDEGVWGWAKYHRMANFAPEDLGELRSRIGSELSSLSERGDLLASFIRHARIQIRL